MCALGKEKSLFQRVSVGQVDDSFLHTSTAPGYFLNSLAQSIKGGYGRVWKEFLPFPPRGQSQPSLLLLLLLEVVVVELLLVLVPKHMYYCRRGEEGVVVSMRMK